MKKYKKTGYKKSKRPELSIPDISAYTNPEILILVEHSDHRYIISMDFLIVGSGRSYIGTAQEVYEIPFICGLITEGPVSAVPITTREMQKRFHAALLKLNIRENLEQWKIYKEQAEEEKNPAPDEKPDATAES